MKTFKEYYSILNESIFAASSRVDVFDFFDAVNDGELDKVKTYIERGTDVNIRDPRNYTALHNAAMHENFEMVRMLLDYGADPTARSVHDNTAYDLANDPGIKRMLASAMRKRKKGVNESIFQGPTEDEDRMLKYSFLKAVEHNDIKTMDRCLDKGADIETRTFDGNTALMLAAYYSHAEAALWLLDKGADPYVKNRHRHNLYSYARLSYADLGANELYDSDFRFRDKLAELFPGSKRIF